MCVGEPGQQAAVVVEAALVQVALVGVEARVERVEVRAVLEVPGDVRRGPELAAQVHRVRAGQLGHRQEGRHLDTGCSTSTRYDVNNKYLLS